MAGNYVLFYLYGIFIRFPSISERCNHENHEACLRFQFNLLVCQTKANLLYGQNMI